MIIRVFKCLMCGHQFEMEVFDRKDPNERHIQGARIHCPKCSQTRIEPVR